ncbi:MAG: hypothetical protein R3E66_01930 [bacterium]
MNYPELSQFRMIDEQLRATVVVPGSMGSSWITPEVSVGKTELKSVAHRHGDMTWTAPVEGENAIWVASSDGLVKRWDFDTGRGESHDIPYEFAIGGAHATRDGGLVLKSRFWNADEKKFETGERVMVWHPTRPPVTVTISGLSIRDAALANPSTLVVVGEASTVWWDLTKGQVVHQESGRGHLSENGQSIAFFDAVTTFRRTVGPARFMRTNDPTRVHTIKSVLSCAFSPDGSLFVCGEPQKEEYKFWRRVYAVEDGAQLGELSMNGSGAFAHVSPEGDADLVGDYAMLRYLWTTTTGGTTGLPEDDFYLGFSSDGRVITVRGEFIALEPY